MRRLKFNQLHTAWRRQGWDRDAGRLEPAFAVFLITPALMRRHCGYQFLSLSRSMNHVDSFDRLWKAVLLHLKNSGFLQNESQIRTMTQLTHHFKTFKVTNSGSENKYFINICSKSKNCQSCLKRQGPRAPIRSAQIISTICQEPAGNEGLVDSLYLI